MPEHAHRFPDIVLPHLADVPPPVLRRVRQKQTALPALLDVPGAVRGALEAQGAVFDLPAGAGIAVGCRGIADIDRSARTAVDRIKARVFTPFISREEMAVSKPCAEQLRSRDLPRDEGPALQMRGNGAGRLQQRLDP